LNPGAEWRRYPSNYDACIIRLPYPFTQSLQCQSDQ
jgi:hypothetical protein